MSVPDKELEQLVQNLNEQNKTVAKNFLMWLLDSQMNEDDTLTPSDIQAIDQARKDLENGETTSLEELKRELDL